MTLGIYFARGSTGGVGKLALGHGGSTCCRKPRDHLCGPCSVFILGLRLKGQQLAGRSSFPGCVGGTGENTHLRGHISSLSFLFLIFFFYMGV